MTADPDLVAEIVEYLRQFVDEEGKDPEDRGHRGQLVDDAQAALVSWEIRQGGDQ